MEEIFPFVRYLPVLLEGLLGTIRIAVVSLLLSAPIGLVVGAGRYSKRPLFAWPARVFVEVFRNTPILVLIIWFFFAFPMLVPFRIDAYTAAVLALTLNSGAFFAEIFRAGIQSIAKGQWEAARALGMSYRQQMRRIILPQAIRRMIPAFTNRWIELFKLTSLSAAIAYHDLTHTARLVASAYYNPVEAFTVAAFIYFLAIYPMVQLTYLIERRLRKGE